MKSSYLKLYTFFLLTTSFIITPLDSVAEAREIELERLVSELKVALLKVQQNALTSNLPPLSDVELEVNTVQSKGTDGKISLYVVELGVALSHEITNTVKLTLTPPSAMASSEISSAKLSDSLSESIISGARAIALAKKGSPPLKARKLEVTIKFGIKKDGDGNLSISFPPFEAEGGGAIGNSSIQTIKITYEYK